MIKDRLLSLLGDMEGPPSFAEHRGLLSAHILRFPDEATLPQDPDVAYGRDWHSRFRLPHSPVGVEDSQSLIILEDTKPNAVGLGEERRFLFIQPLPRPFFPIEFYLAWGTSWLSFTTEPLRMNAAIDKKGEWFVGEPGSEFSDGKQMANVIQKCECLISPGVTTAFEQLAYLANAERTNRCT